AGIIGGSDWVPPPRRSGKTRTGGGDDPSRLRQVLGGGDADAGGERAQVRGEPPAMPQPAQLLEPLDVLERAVREAGEAAQEAGPVRVEADVAKRRARRRRRARRVVARPRDRCARKVERMVAGVEDDLDDVGVL